MVPNRKSQQVPFEQNPTLACALNSLVHPISIGAILLLLLNDHWLRYTHPSWLTGKLGDFSWLVFAPFICAVFLSWLIPKRFKGQVWIIGCTSVLIIGIWFALAKTIPAVHLLTSAAWEAVIGWQGTQRLDPTDLLTLPALLLSLYIWKSVQHRTFRYSHHGWLLLALGVVTTLASDAPAYVYTKAGVTTICTQGDHLVIYLVNGGDYVDENGQSVEASPNNPSHATSKPQLEVTLDV